MKGNANPAGTGFTSHNDNGWAQNQQILDNVRKNGIPVGLKNVGNSKFI